MTWTYGCENHGTKESCLTSPLCGWCEQTLNGFSQCLLNANCTGISYFCKSSLEIASKEQCEGTKSMMDTSLLILLFIVLNIVWMLNLVIINCIGRTFDLSKWIGYIIFMLVTTIFWIVLEVIYFEHVWLLIGAMISSAIAFDIFYWCLTKAKDKCCGQDNFQYEIS